MALFGVAAFLLFLIQCLLLFDVITSKGQSFFTLIGQALLGMPGLGIVFLYVCLGIGLGRALRNLQGSSELGIIHSSGLVPSLLRAIGLYALLGAFTLLVLAHIVEPLSNRATSQWAAGIAADLVSRSMVPHRFVELVNNVTVVIGSRDTGGNIEDFFADDSRNPNTRRTYFARSAIITKDDEGYVLRMHDGAVQYLTDDGRFSEISFTGYDLPLDSLTGATSTGDDVGQRSSLQILASGHLDDDDIKALLKRSGEGLRVVAMCVLVGSLAAFPNGNRRRFEVPIELTVLGAAFLERAVSSYAGGPGIVGVSSGAIGLLLVGLLIFAYRLRLLRPARLKVAA